MLVVRRDHVLTSELDGDLVMLDPRRSQYFGLDSIGRRVWELIATPTGIDPIVEVLLDEYDVDRDRCRREVSALLDEMIDAGLAERLPAG